MKYDLSSIYKNFEFYNNDLKKIEEIEITKYKGIQCGQVNGFHHLLNILFLKQSFENVIELGTGNGGTRKTLCIIKIPIFILLASAV